MQGFYYKNRDCDLFPFDQEKFCDVLFLLSKQAFRKIFNITLYPTLIQSSCLQALLLVYSNMCIPDICLFSHFLVTSIYFYSPFHHLPFLSVLCKRNLSQEKFHHTAHGIQTSTCTVYHGEMWTCSGQRLEQMMAELAQLQRAGRKKSE